MKGLLPRAEAERPPQGISPAHPHLVSEAGRGGGHRVEPPALFGLQSEPVANADCNFFGGDVGLLDRPQKHQQFLAKKPLHSRIIGAPAAGWFSVDLKPAIELCSCLGGRGIPHIARHFAAKDRLRCPCRSVRFGGGPAKDLEDKRLRLAALGGTSRV